jgi:hypothetical protein
MRPARSARQSGDEAHDRPVRVAVDGSEVDIADHAATGTGRSEPPVAGNHRRAHGWREHHRAAGVVALGFGLQPDALFGARLEWPALPRHKPECASYRGLIPQLTNALSCRAHLPIVQ